MADEANGATQAQESRTISLEDVERVLRLVVTMSQRWTALMLVLAVVSVVSLTIKGGSIEGSIAVTPITVALIALIWLPALVNVVALAGGGLKTPAGEVSAGGLLQLLRSLEPAAQRGALPAVIAALDTGANRDDPQVKRLRQRLQSDLAGLPVDAGDARQRLTALAREYEAVRQTMPSGPDRTFKMTQIVTEACGLAASARLDPQTLSGIWLGPGDGDRIVTLAVIQARPDATHLPIVEDAIAHARSPFEQYHGLVAARRLVDLLDDAGRRTLAAAIRERMGLHLTGVSIDRRDSDRQHLAEQVLAALEG